MSAIIHAAGMVLLSVLLQAKLVCLTASQWSLVGTMAMALLVFAVLCLASCDYKRLAAYSTAFNVSILLCLIVVAVT